MFTGIVQTIGVITQLEARGDDVRLTIHAPDLDLSDVALGDSIAHNGVCLTVIARTDQHYQVDVSRASLACTVGLDQVPQPVNLEKALRLADRLGGHLVSGHVDGVGTVTHFSPVGDCFELRVDAPAELAHYLATKGSVTLNGVSLTTNWVDGTQFSINLIPHTLERTTLKHLKPGARVNLEIDLIARYVERMLRSNTSLPTV